jgi:hypothetical protein
MPPTTLEQLQAMLERTEGAHRAVPPGWKSAPVQTGSPLDPLLPPGGLPRGSLVEWLGQGSGSGATRLALSVARAALGVDVGSNHTGYEIRDTGYAGRNRNADRNRGASKNHVPALVVIDRQRHFYAPAAARLGIDPSGLIIVRPVRQADELWALDQAVRCTGVAAVLWRGDKLDARHFRRLQLACQASGVIGLLVRPATARQEPSWADVRLLVGSRPAARIDTTGPGSTARPSAVCQSALPPWSAVRRLQVQVVRCRGRTAGTLVELEIDDETLQIRSATALRMAARRPARCRRPA